MGLIPKFPQLDPSTEARRQRERIGTYMMGVALGLMILGIYWAGRTMMVNTARQQQAQQPAPSKP